MIPVSEDRPYQIEAVARGCEELTSGNARGKSTLIVMATGGGKTRIGARMIQQLASRGRAIWFAHRTELIDQAVDQISKITGMLCDVEMADQTADRRALWTVPVIVGSIQTQIAGTGNFRRMDKFDPAQFGLVVIDECHHAPAASYRHVIDYYRRNPQVAILGLTATPDRADEQALGQMFDSVAYEYDLRNAIEDGWLVPVRQAFASIDSLDFAHCKSRDGDINGAELARELEFEEPLHEVVTAILEHAGDRKTLIFGARIQHAVRLSEILNRHQPGCSTYLVDKMNRDDRRASLAAYRAGEHQFLCNVAIASEGFDIPDIACVVLARPTKSRSRYAQQIGRGTRTLAGLVDRYATAAERREAIAASAKPDLLVLDLVGNSGRHRLITTLDILGGKYEDDVIDLAVREAQKGDLPVDPLDALRKAEQEARRLAREAEESRRRFIKAKGKTTLSWRDPFDVFSVTPNRVAGWHRGRPLSDKQRGCLERFRIEDKILDNLDFVRGSQLIGTLIQRSKDKLCTYRQAKTLRKFGQDPTEMSFTMASATLDKLIGGKRR